MSIFYCNRCDNLADADDGCDEDPSDDRELICIECMEALEVEAADTTDPLASPGITT